MPLDEKGPFIFLTPAEDRLQTLNQFVRNGSKIHQEKVQAHQMSETQEHAERYLAAANEAAHAASHLYITFLLLGTYIGVIIASTTDEQLLRVSPVTLPILDVKLPIRGFYTFVPWLFLLLHFNLLLHFHLLARKLHAFDKSAAEHEDAENLALRERLANISFVHMLVGRQHDPFLSGLLAFMVWITVVALPLSLLLWAQIAFLPFHDPDITWGQRIAVFLDAGLLLLFWGRIISSQGAISWWMQRFDQIRAWAIWGWSWFWARIRKFVRWLPWNLVRLNRPARSGPSGALFVLAVTIGASATSLLIATVPDEPWEMCMLNWLPKQWIIQCEEGGSRLQRQCFSITAAFSKGGMLSFIEICTSEKRC